MVFSNCYCFSSLYIVICEIVCDKNGLFGKYPMPKNQISLAQKFHTKSTPALLAVIEKITRFRVFCPISKVKTGLSLEWVKNGGIFLQQNSGKLEVCGFGVSFDRDL